ncbi:MAG: hypothetical protein U0414_10105 [Polyangiaceae bacterium]
MDLGLTLPLTSHPELALSSLLSVAYQASLLRDEDRALSFRIVLGPPALFPAQGGPPYGAHRLLFERPLPFEVHELRKLAPAVKFQRSLVGVNETEGRIEIWGVVHTGPRWLRFAQGGRGPAPELNPSALVIHVNGPGDLVVSLASQTLARLFAGELTTPMLDVFDASWLPQVFLGQRDEIRVAHDAEREAASEPWANVDLRTIGYVSRNLIRRIVATIRAGRHGGAILIVPPDAEGALSERGLLDIKYKFVDAEPRRRFRSLLLNILAELGRLGARNEVEANWELYEETESKLIVAFDEAVFEVAHLVAALSDVDGMVVLNHRFEILGFGAVVSGHLPEVDRVSQALDLDGDERIDEATSAVGTRHRAAYRVTAAIPGSLAIVVSQDGSVRFIRDVDGRVTYWDQVAAAAFGG